MNFVNVALYPQTTLTFEGILPLSIAGETHEKLTSIRLFLQSQIETVRSRSSTHR